MRVCDWIANYLHEQGVRNIYGIMGGGASGLNDGFIKHGNLNYICCHHEQGAGHAAIGEARFTGKIAVVNPTTGCGGTNCATSVLNAWQDGIPLVFISGNVRSNTCTNRINLENGLTLRKYGIQEHNIIDTVKSMTKFASFISSPNDVPSMLNLAIKYATNGRPGPVWIDIPGDVQIAEMPLSYQITEPQFLNNPKADSSSIQNTITLMASANRPIVLAGYGIRQSDTVTQFRQFVERYHIPFVGTYGAADLVPTTHPLYIGTIGIKGSRAGNFALQNADFMLILGASLNASQVGYDPAQFSPHSIKVYVDCEQDELKKNIVKIDHILHCDLRDFFKDVL